VCVFALYCVMLILSVNIYRGCLD